MMLTMLVMLWNVVEGPANSFMNLSGAGTVILAVPVFHLFNSGNPDFIMYMDELRVDEFGMTFHLQYSKHLR